VIPDFDDNDNLPPGTHSATLSGVLKRFGSGSPKRKYLTKHLRELLVLLRNVAIGVYIDGSYITRKLAPHDVDLLILLPRDFDWDGPEGRKLEACCKEEWKRKQKEEHRLHIYYGVPGEDVKHMRSLVRTWTRDRNSKPKGIVYVELRG
jgi:hypothetical protein